jgi:glycosyltransferase involved in cell wall biosynthesis
LLGAAEQQAASGTPSKERIIRIHGPLVGQSPEFVERLEKAVLSGIVEYAGPYQNEDVGELMAACDYVVVPSLWWENSPVVIQESYASGRPLIVSGIGGMAEKVVEGVTGFHFAPGNSSDLLRTMKSSTDPEVYQRLCAQLPAAHTPEQMALDYLAVFVGAGKDKADASTCDDRPTTAARRR